MSFQTKLLITYTLLIVLLVVILGASFYFYSTGILRRNAFTNLSVIADKMSQQFDSHIIPMDLLITYLLSDGNIMRSISMLASIDREAVGNNIYVTEAKSIIQSSLLSYAIDRNFYRVSFINNNGDFLTSNFRDPIPSGNISDVANGLIWREEADKYFGRKVITPPYIDPWAQLDKTKVFSLVRMIRVGGSMGYIEVQSPYQELERIFSIPVDNGVNIVVITETGNILFENKISNVALTDYYASLASMGDISLIDKKNPISGHREMIVGTSSDYTGVNIILAQDKSTLFRPFLYANYLVAVIGILVIGVSFGYIYIFSARLTKPIRELKNNMESTKLDNLPDVIELKNSNNEIEALNASFQRLKERLTEAVNREIKSQSLQILASFDSLQAQVNPHFIYNILNVLSNKGIEYDDDEICEICACIASMLRYSTSTLERLATIKDEIDHVTNYLLLMKKRFEHRLLFDVQIDEKILKERIPKIVLQQIVENSIEHGFRDSNRIMQIQVRGYEENNCWYIMITDNGEGFKPEVLEQLHESMKSMDNELMGTKMQTGYAIGGMGLINTYGRFLLFFKDNFVFTLENQLQGGARVLVGGKIHSKKENIQSV